MDTEIKASAFRPVNAHQKRADSGWTEEHRQEQRLKSLEQLRKEAELVETRVKEKHAEQREIEDHLRRIIAKFGFVHR